MRIDATDLDQYIKQMKTGKVQVTPVTGLAGFEPAHDGVKVRCLTAWL